MESNLLGDCEIEFVTKDNNFSKQVLTKSTLLLLGSAIETLYNGIIANSFVNDSDFYYDSYINNKVSNFHCNCLDDKCGKLC